LREAFPIEAPRKYLIFDRDQKFGFEVIAAVFLKPFVTCRTESSFPTEESRDEDG